MQVARPSVIASAAGHTAFLDCAGRLLTCGRDPHHHGFLGQGDVRRVSVPSAAPLPPSVRIASLAAGGSHTLAISTEGRVFSFGFGQGGRLGHGDEASQPTPRLVNALRGERVCAAAVGSGCSIALTDAGRIYSWGQGGHGQLGHGPTVDGALADEHSPRAIAALSATAVWAASIGGYHVLALSASGDVYSWGQGHHGQLGHGDTQQQLLPCRLEGLRGWRVTAVAAGGVHSLAVGEATDLGRPALLSWGQSGEGRLGHAGREKQLTPKPVSAMAGVPVASVAAGYQHSLVVSRAGAVFSFGRGLGGALGHDEENTEESPRPVDALAGVRVVGAAAGDRTSLVVADDGAVYGWGRGAVWGGEIVSDPVLGLGLSHDQLVPLRYRGLRAPASPLPSAVL